MRFQDTEDQAMIRDTVAAFVRDRLAEQAMRWNEHGPGADVRAVVGELAEMGMLGVAVGESFGGAGMGACELIVALTELAAGDAGVATILAGHSAALQALTSADSPDKSLIGELAAGAKLGCIADAGSTVALGAGLADIAVVTGPSWQVVELADTEPTRLLGLRTATAATVEGQATVLGGVGAAEVDGLRRLGAAAIAVGIGTRALQAGVGYSLERIQFGKPIARFQPIQWMTADSATELETARLLTNRAAWLHDAGKAWTDAAARACSLALRHARSVTHRAHQMHGGAGYTKEYVVERLYRDAHALHVLAGSAEVAKIEIATTLAAGL